MGINNITYFWLWKFTKSHKKERSGFGGSSSGSSKDPSTSWVFNIFPCDSSNEDMIIISASLIQVILTSQIQTELEESLRSQADCGHNLWCLMFPSLPLLSTSYSRKKSWCVLMMSYQRRTRCSVVDIKNSRRSRHVEQITLFICSQDATAVRVEVCFCEQDVRNLIYVKWVD